MPIPAIIPAAVSAASALAGTITQGIQNAKARKEARNLKRLNQEQEVAFNWNTRLADYQNDLALKNWQLENEYNSPQAQMQRYLDAGLNPNLVYGAGASSGNAGNIGTPTVGGSVSPTDIQDAATRERNQRVSAAQTALAMLGQTADVFEKLLTIKGSIQAQNAENEGKASIGLYNRDYWNWLRPKSLDAATAKIFDWNAQADENLLRQRIADYKLNFHDAQELYSDEFGNYGTPYYIQDLQTRLQDSQADLQYQGLMNGFQTILNEIAGNPEYGKAVQSKKEVELLDKKLQLAGIDWLLRHRQYEWFPYTNGLGLVGKLIPKFSFGKKSFNGTMTNVYKRSK